MLLTVFVQIHKCVNNVLKSVEHQVVGAFLPSGWCIPTKRLVHSYQAVGAFLPSGWCIPTKRLVHSDQAVAQVITMIINYTLFLFSHFEYKTKVIFDKCCVLFMKHLRDLCFVQYFPWPDRSHSQLTIDGIRRHIF